MMRPAWTSILAGAALWLAASPLSAAPSAIEDAAFLDALTWGVSPTSFAELRAKGREAWLREQLHPPAVSPLPAAVQGVVNEGPRDGLYEHTLYLFAFRRAADAEPDPTRARARASITKHS